MALLKNGTRIYGFGVVDGQLSVGNIVTSNTNPLQISSGITRSTSNTTGTIVITNGGGLATRGNIYSGNIVITGAVNSNGITFVDNTRQVTSALEKANTQAQIVEGNIIANTGFIVRGAITDDQGNNTVVFGTSSPVLIQNTATSTSNNTGALVINGGLGVAGNTFLNNSLAAVTTTTSAVNYLQASGNTTSNAVTLSAQGTDTNISMNLVSKGFGSINFNTQAPVVSIVDRGPPVVVARPFLFAPCVPGFSGGVLTLPSDGSGYIQTSDSNPIVFGTFGPSDGKTFSTNTQFRISHTASAVNYLQVTGNTTGGSPVLSAQGNDTNIGINIVPKGNGSVNITSTATSTSNTRGALVVYGGVGISGNVYTSGNVVISRTTASVSNTTGALIVSGGAGVAGNVYADFVYSNTQDVIATSLMYSVAFG